MSVENCSLVRTYIVAFLLIEWLVVPCLCSLDFCSKDKNHLLCDKGTQKIIIYDKNDPCRMIRPYVVTSEDRKKILSFFNNYRNGVAFGENQYMTIKTNLPNAGNMNQLAWSDILANAAQNAAQMCNFETNETRLCATCRQFDNLQAEIIIIKHEALPVTLNYERDLKKQGSSFSTSMIESYSADDKYSFFTLITNAKTRYIGCGRASAPQFKDLCSISKEFMMEICLVAAAENRDDTQIVKIESASNQLFRIGKPCSHCQKDFECSSSFSGLCKSRITEGTIGHEKYASTNPQPITKLPDPYNYCEFHSDHILCETRERCQLSNESFTKGVRPLKMTNVDKEDLLGYLNFFRSNAARNEYVFENQKIQFSEAADMIKVEWSDELERAATNYAMCDSYHEKCPRCFMFDNEIPADSIMFEHRRIPTNSTYISYLTAVFDKFQNKYNKGVINNFAAKKMISNHFELFMYSKMTYIGCARVTPSPLNTAQSCSGAAPFAFERCLTYPSVYADENMEYKEDNIVNLYTEGTPCSKCPEGFECWKCPPGKVCHGVNSQIGLCQNKNLDISKSVIPKARPKNPPIMRTTTFETTKMSLYTLARVVRRADAEVTTINGENTANAQSNDTSEGSGDNINNNNNSSLGHDTASNVTTNQANSTANETKFEDETVENTTGTVATAVKVSDDDKGVITTQSSDVVSTQSESSTVLSRTTPGDVVSDANSENVLTGSTLNDAVKENMTTATGSATVVEYNNMTTLNKGTSKRYGTVSVRPLPAATTTPPDPSKGGGTSRIFNSNVFILFFAYMSLHVDQLKTE